MYIYIYIYINIYGHGPGAWSPENVFEQFFRQMDPKFSKHLCMNNFVRAGTTPQQQFHSTDATEQI